MFRRARRRGRCAEVQEQLTSAVTVPTTYPPDITLEELDGDEIVVRIVATPERPANGARLASEVLAAIRKALRRADENGGAARDETAPATIHDAT